MRIRWARALDSELPFAEIVDIVDVKQRTGGRLAMRLSKAHDTSAKYRHWFSESAAHSGWTAGNEMS